MEYRDTAEKGAAGLRAAFLLSILLSIDSDIIWHHEG
jgi:hypothetical protein